MEKWKNKYIIEFCDSCDTFIIKCEKCGHGSCSGGSCEECHKDFNEFNVLKPSVYCYLQESEKDLYQYKIKRIFKFLTYCANKGIPGINWEIIYINGQYCDHDFGFFPELVKFHKKLKTWPDSQNMYDNAT